MVERDERAANPKFKIALMADDPAPEPTPVPVPLTAKTVALWEAPTLNEDGTPLIDLSHYDVALAAADAHLNTDDSPLALKRVDAISSTTEVQILELFGDEVLAGVQSLWAAAVDHNGNRGRWAGPVFLNFDAIAPGMLGNFRVEIQIIVTP
jgi:hypothetical protein